MGTSFKGQNLLPEAANSVFEELYPMVWNNNRWFSLNMFNFHFAHAYLRNGSYAYVNVHLLICSKTVLTVYCVVALNMDFV